MLAQDKTLNSLLCGLAAGACSVLIAILTLVLLPAFSWWVDYSAPFLTLADIWEKLPYGLVVFSATFLALTLAQRHALPLLWASGTLSWIVYLAVVTDRVLHSSGIAFLDLVEIVAAPLLEWSIYFVPLLFITASSDRVAHAARGVLGWLGFAWAGVYMFALYVYGTYPWIEIDPKRFWEPSVTKAISAGVFVVWPIFASLFALAVLWMGSRTKQSAGAA